MFYTHSVELGHLLSPCLTTKIRLLVAKDDEVAATASLHPKVTQEEMGKGPWLKLVPESVLAQLSQNHSAQSGQAQPRQPCWANQSWPKDQPKLLQG